MSDTSLVCLELKFSSSLLLMFVYTVIYCIGYLC